MKHSSSVTLVLGFLLLILAAFFTVTIMLQFVNFEMTSISLSNIPVFLYKPGELLFSVYGYTSLLIPCFFFVCGILLFITSWSARWGVYLLGSIIPFATAAVTEMAVRYIHENDASKIQVFKIGALILVGILLIAIEYLLIGIVADYIVSFLRQHRKKDSDTHAAEAKFAVSDYQVPLADTVAPDLPVEDFAEQREPFEPVTMSNPIIEAFLKEDLEDTHDVQPAVQIYGNDEEVLSPVGIEPQSEPEIEPELDIDEELLEYFDDADEVEELEDNKHDDMDGYDTVDIPPVSDDEVIFLDLNWRRDGEPEPASELLSDTVLDSRFELSPRFEPEPDVEVDDELYNEEENKFLEDPYDENDEIYQSDLDEDNQEQCSLDETVLASVPVQASKNNVLLDGSIGNIKRGLYSVPVEGLLTVYPDGAYWVIDSETQRAGNILKETLSEFKIEAEVTGIRKGPVITMFEILPAPGVKLNKIVALQDNIALRLAASSVRIVAPIPGKHAVGIEVPNKERSIVSFKELIETDHPGFKKMEIPVLLGKDISGDCKLLDLAATPHLLIAGSTGSGKSVCVNTMILSILYKRSPQEVKMILIDPKIVELKLYNDIPHLLTPVITEPKKAFQALQYCLCEMERRYALLDRMGVRDVKSYNRRIDEDNLASEKIPYIVVVIDEFADLMATTGKELESTVARLAAMSRAVGVHLVLATQRPSIDVITGLIKANIPTRIAFMVASKMDSRIIIDQVGAEKLLGKGDMLYSSAASPFPVRIQGTFVSEEEVQNVVEYVKRFGEPEYIDDEIFLDEEDEEMLESSLFSDGADPLYDKALEIVLQAGKASASYIQRRLKVGYNRAARLVEEMEQRGIVGPANGSKPREIIHVPSSVK